LVVGASFDGRFPHVRCMIESFRKIASPEGLRMGRVTILPWYSDVEVRGMIMQI